MATHRPEYFYHPAVGVVSPASLDLFRLNATTVPPAPLPALILSEPSPVTAQTPAHLPDTQAVMAPMQPNILEISPIIPAPRKPMTLSRTAVCAVTGETLPQQDMIRFVITPDNVVMADLSEKLPGNAVYIKADRGILQKALWRNTFTSIARDTVAVPEDLIASIERGLSKLALETISLARRAGDLTMGFAKVEEKLQSQPLSIYVVASDASDHGRVKLAKLAKAAPIIDLWTSDELSAALGEANTNHILLGFGGLAEKLSRLAHKLKAVRSDK